MAFTYRLSLRLLLATLALGAACAAQGQPAGAPQGSAFPGAEDPGAALSRNLTLLANNPNSVAALTGAARAALDLDDPQAALTFYGRAEELAPRDGRIKAGIGSAMLMMEQAQPALKFFDEAARLGVAEADFAGDRGLAYDLSGDPARAQQDYQLALRRRDDPEIRRRLALSLAIGGKRDAALAAIDDQLRRQDRAAWRTRAFVLALTGDTAGANRAVAAAMPSQAEAMAPFLARLPSLNLADRALAVHFGHFPGTGQAVQTASVAPPAAQANPVTAAGRPDTAQPPLGAAPSGNTRVATRLHPAAAPTAAAPPPSPPPSPSSPAPSPSPSPSPSPAPTPSPLPAPVQAAVLPQPVQVAAPPQPAPAPAPPQPAQIASIAPVSLPSASLPPAPGFSLQPGDRPSAGPAPPGAANPVAAPAESAPTAQSAAAELSGTLAPASSAATGEIRSLADVSALVAGLSDPASAPQPAPKAAAVRPPAKPAVARAGEAVRKDEKAAPKEPSRIWVQLAQGASAAVLPREFARIKAKAPKQLGKRDPWAATQRSTSRLLVGPFKTNKDAQDLINQLDKAKVAAVGWTSPAGLEVKKLPAK